MKLFVGSDNPVKVNAVTIAASETWPEVTATGFKVASQVSDQPIGDDETRTGAENRARAALEAGLKTITDASDETCLGIGLEGGVVELFPGELWSTVWVVVIDQQGYITRSNGARFKVPDQIADYIKKGEEMGPVVSRIVKVSDVRKKQGMIGVITNSFVDRTEEYTGIAKMALGLWYGREWYQQL